MGRTLFLVSIVLSTGCAAPSVEVTPRYGFAELSGDFAVSSGSISGTTSMEDLDLDDQEELVGVRADLKFGMPHLSVVIAGMSAEGTGTTTVDLTQSGTTIPAGANVDSELDLTYGNAIVTFDFLPTDAVELGLGFGLETVGIETSVRETGTGARIEVDETVPIPVVALRAGAAFGPFEVDGTIAGISYAYSGDSIDFFDLDLRARWKVFDYAHLVVGYTRVDVDLEYEDGSDDVLLDVVAEGPYLGVAFAF